MPLKLKTEKYDQCMTHTCSKKDIRFGIYEVSFNSTMSICLITSLFSSFFAVPPNPVVIFDETGKRRASVVGPYLIGDTIHLVCDAFGGKISSKIETNHVYHSSRV